MYYSFSFTFLSSFFFQNSLVVNSNAFADDGIKTAKPLDKFQFERVGYFSVDSDTTNEKVKIKYQLIVKLIYFVFNFSMYLIEQ